jgi:hypothetical protein
MYRILAIAYNNRKYSSSRNLRGCCRANLWPAKKTITKTKQLLINKKMGERIIKLKQLENLLSNYQGSSAQVDELFELHNYFLPGNREMGKHCGSCRQRVFNRINDNFNVNFKQELHSYQENDIKDEQ